MKGLYFLSMIFSGILFAQDGSFEQYKVPSLNVKMSKVLVADTEMVKKYQKTFVKEFDLGPNFAGKFRIVRMECSKTCTRLFIINNETGVVFDPELSVDGTPPPTFRGDIIQFKNDSRLLIISGCLNGDKTKCGQHEFSWNTDKFKFEFFRPFSKS